MNNFLKYLAVFLFFTGLSLNGFGQFLQKGKGPYSTGNYLSYSDSSNIYVTGNFVCKLTVDTFTVNVNGCDSTTTDPRVNFYALRMNRKGEVDWIRNSLINDPATEFTLKGTQTDSYDNLYVAGNYKSSIPVDSVNTISTSSEKDGFVLKRKRNGDLEWILDGFSLEGTSMVNINGIKRDTTGTPLIFGSFKGKCRFGTDTLNSTSEQLFIARVKADSQCDLVAYGEAHGDSSYSFVSDLMMTDSNLVLALHAEDSVVFKAKDSLKMLSPADTANAFDYYTDTTIQADTTFRDSSTGWEVIQVVDTITYDTTLIDTFHVDSSYLNRTYSYLALLKGDSVFDEMDRGYFPNAQNITRDDSNNKYLLINYSDSCIIHEDTLLATGKRNFLLAKYLANGDFGWHHSASSSTTNADLLANSISTDEKGNVYVGGRYGDTLRNDAFEFVSSTIDSSNNADGFIIKLRSGGNVVWMQRAGGGSRDEVNHLVTVDSINLIGAGHFSEYIEFGTLSDSNYYGDRNLFSGTIDPYPAFDFEVNPESEASVCKGDSLLFTVTGDPAFEYQWQKDGFDIPGADSSSFYAKDSGSYRVLVTDTTLPYTRKSKPIAFDVHPIPKFTIWTNDDTTFCDGDYATLKTEAQSPDHSYRWYRDGSFAGDTSKSYDGYSTGDYNVQVISPYGCDSSSRTIQLTRLLYPSGTIAPGDGTSFCDGDSLDLQAAEGPGYTYRWFNDDEELPDDTNSVLRIKEAGTYSVIVSNRIGCATQSSNYSYNVIPSPDAVLSFIGDSVLCQGDSTILAANTGLDFTYKWYKNNVEIPGEDQFSITVFEAGTYSVDVGYQGSCSRRSNLKEVVVHSNPVTPLNVDGNTSICEGQSTILSTPYQEGHLYNWYINGQIISGAGSNEYEVTQSGDYRVEEINQNNCNNFSDYQRILVKPSPNASLFHKSDSVFCEGDSVELYTYEFPSYEYSWKKDGEWINGAKDYSYVAKHTGDYSVLVEDTELSCSSVSPVMRVIENAAPDEVISADKPLPICDGDTVLLSVNDNENWSYQWFLDDFQIYQDTNASLRAAEMGEYKVEMVNESGCAAYSPTLDINLKPNAVPRITVNGLFISTKSYDNLQWNFNGSPIEDANNPVYLVEESGEYSVTVFHDNGCIATSEPVVICNPVPTIKIDESWLTASDGSAYQWYYEGDTIKGATQQKYQVQMSGHYSVDVTRQGCTSRSQEVEVCIPVPTITVLEQDILEASPGQSFQWYKGETMIGGADARMFAVQESGSYKVEVEDFDGCISFSRPVDVYIDTTDYTPTASHELGSSNVKIYPNPVNSVLYLDLSGASFQEGEIFISDITGKLILRRRFNYSPEPLSVSLSQLPPGIYILELRDEKNILRGKIIKE